MLPFAVSHDEFANFCGKGDDPHGRGLSAGCSLTILSWVPITADLLYLPDKPATVGPAAPPRNP
jgi:hypothetical protein